MPDGIFGKDTGTAARRFHKVVQRARVMAEEQHVTLKTHVIDGHGVRDILILAADLNVDLLVIGGGPSHPRYFVAAGPASRC